MSNYYEEQENTQMVPGIDVSALSPKVQRRLALYMDEEGEEAMRGMISIQKAVVVGNRAIAAQAAVAQVAASACQMLPQEADRIDEIVARVHKNLCDIVDGKRRY